MLRKSQPRHSASLQQSSGCPLKRDQCMAAPERLVGLGFRYWMLGRLSGDVACWEGAWDLYSGVFGIAGGKMAIGGLSSWVAALDRAGSRSIEVYPRTCRGFCRDECFAISMIAACQHQTCPALRACAFALIECSMIDEVIAQAQDFADTLAGLDHILSPASIVAAPSSLPLSPQLLH